ACIASDQTSLGRQAGREPQPDASCRRCPDRHSLLLLPDCKPGKELLPPRNIRKQSARTDHWKMYRGSFLCDWAYELPLKIPAGFRPSCCDFPYVFTSILNLDLTFSRNSK